jgi:phage baseplate assembly protein gpV
VIWSFNLTVRQQLNMEGGMVGSGGLLRAECIAVGASRRAAGDSEF